MGQERQDGKMPGETVAAEQVKPTSEESRIRLRAHEIWVAEGKPDGRALDHWLRARWEVETAPDPKGPIERLEGYVKQSGKSS